MLNSDLHDDTPLMSGSASTTSPMDEQNPDPLAVLWVPDIEQTHGWREFYVYPKKMNTAKPGMGFRK